MNRLALLVAAVALSAAGCGYLPPLPEPVEIGGEPSAQPAVTSDATTWSPDGFTSSERVAIRVRNVGCGGVRTGSGFALSANQLVTNRHVVAGARMLQVSTYDGQDLLVDTAGAGLVADLAIVDTGSQLPAAVTLAERNPEIGESVEVVGYPGGGRLTSTTGTVLGYEPDPLNTNAGDVVVTDAQAEPGSSGSPMYNENGEVIGVVYAATDDGTHSLAVPVETLRQLLDEASFTDELPPCA
jgi:S1-C subfamily serine protease